MPPRDVRLPPEEVFEESSAPRNNIDLAFAESLVRINPHYNAIAIDSTFRSLQSAAHDESIVEAGLRVMNGLIDARILMEVSGPWTGEVCKHFRNGSSRIDFGVERQPFIAHFVRTMKHFVDNSTIQQACFEVIKSLATFGGMVNYVLAPGGFLAFIATIERRITDTVNPVLKNVCYWLSELVNEDQTYAIADALELAGASSIVVCAFKHHVAQNSAAVPSILKFIISLATRLDSTVAVFLAEASINDLLAILESDVPILASKIGALFLISVLASGSQEIKEAMLSNANAWLVFRLLKKVQDTSPRRMFPVFNFFHSMVQDSPGFDSMWIFVKDSHGRKTNVNVALLFLKAMLVGHGGSVKNESLVVDGLAIALAMMKRNPADIQLQIGAMSLVTCIMKTSSSFSISDFVRLEGPDFFLAVMKRFPNNKSIIRAYFTALDIMLRTGDKASTQAWLSTSRFHSILLANWAANDGLLRCKP